MNIQSEVLEQLSTFLAVCLAVHANVVNGLGKQGRGPLNFDRPTGFVSNFDVVFTSAANCRTGVFALYRHFTITCIEIHLRDFGLAWNGVLNEGACSVHVHH